MEQQFSTNFNVEKKVIGILIYNPKDFFKNIYIDKDYFYFPEHRIIFETISTLISKNEKIDIVILSHILSKSIKEPLTTYIEDTSLKENKNLSEYIQILATLDSTRKILALSQTLTEEVSTTKDIDKLINTTIDKLKTMLRNKKRKEIKSFDEALNNTIKEIAELEDGNKAFYITKYEKIDKTISIFKNNILLISGDKQCGKTNFIISLLKKIYDNNPNIMILAFFMEEPKEKFVRRFMSSEILLNDNQIRCINYQHTDKDVNKMADAILSFRKNKYDINFIEKRVNIDDLTMYVRKQHEIAIEKGKELIVLVDNLGLIDVPYSKEQNDKDAKIAGEFVNLKEETKALFIIVHHLVKSTISKWNLIDGYRPREEYISGNSKIANYSDQVILFYKPSKYPDLVELYKRKCVKEPENISTMSLEEICDVLWNVNSQDDFYSKSFTDLKSATLNEMRNYSINKNISPYIIYTKYMEYSNFFDSINDSKDDKYKKHDKQSIYTYLIKGGLNKTYKMNKSPRDEYIFGPYYSIDNEENLKFLENVLIMEVTKNKNAENKESIIRYNANFNTNLFQEF